MSRPLILFVIAAGFTPVAGAQVPPGAEPDLAAIDLPILATARERPEELMAFLFDPATPYTRALAAASRCGSVLPYRLVESLLRSREELHRELQLHQFGLATERVFAMPFGGSGPFARERTILGRAWTVPEERAPYPKTWEDACAAPWPWRSWQVADRAWLSVVQHIGAPFVGGADRNQAWLQRRDAWYAECLRWRTDDEASAQRFFEATSVPPHGKSLAVLARWRRIVLDPRTPITAARIAESIGNVHRQLLFGEPDARLACQILAADAVRASPHPHARWIGCYQCRWFTTVCDEQARETKQPCPPELLLAVGDLGAAPAPAGAVERWNQLYVFVFSVCEAVEKSPVLVERSGGWDKQDVAGKLAQFAAWWPTQRPQIEAQIAARAERVAAVRQQLEALAR